MEIKFFILYSVDGEMDVCEREKARGKSVERFGTIRAVSAPHTPRLMASLDQRSFERW